MDAEAPTPLPVELQNVPRAALEKYINARIREFSRVFVSQLLGPDTVQPNVDNAFNYAMSITSSSLPQQSESFFLRFAHQCKYLGCMDRECQLCINNPNKRCGELDHFDEAYADNQVLKSKCDADVYVQLMSASTGRQGDLSLEVQVSVIDGESVVAGTGAAGFKELLKSDEGQVLLGSHTSGTKGDGSGRVLVKLQDGSCRLPDLFSSDKTDTFHMEGHTYSSFRLMARAFQRDLYGNVVVLEHIAPAVSERFIVKTQRALNDYRKSEYPHYKDELTKLKFIGSITAQRLRDIQAHINADVPFTSIDTVEQLKHLMLYADQNRQVENKLLELLNMKGKHKHKWEYLREILNERIVYDDMVHRAWYTDDSMQQGLLFACKQGQVNMEKPFGIAQRAMVNGQQRLQVLSPSDPQSQELMKTWRGMAEECWASPGHRGWAVVVEPLELSMPNNTSTRSSSGAGLSHRPSMPDSMQGIKRESVLSPHHSITYPGPGSRPFTSMSGPDPQQQGGFLLQNLHSRSSVGGPIDGSGSPGGGIFHFTAGGGGDRPLSRALRLTAGGSDHRGSSGGNTPRSEGGAGGQGLQSFVGGSLLSSLGRGLALDVGAPDSSERICSAPNAFGSGRHGSSAERGPPPHPFASFSAFHDLDAPSSLRVSSSPDVFGHGAVHHTSCPGVAQHSGGAGSPHSGPHSPGGAGTTRPPLALDLSNHDSPGRRGQPGPSRYRRNSATDASLAAQIRLLAQQQQQQQQQSQQQQRTQSPGDRGGGVDLSSVKRPRASLPLADPSQQPFAISPPQQAYGDPQHQQQLAFVDAGAEMAVDPVYAHSGSMHAHSGSVHAHSGSVHSPARSPPALYHSESRGRHHPRHPRGTLTPMGDPELPFELTDHTSPQHPTMLEQQPSTTSLDVHALLLDTSGGAGLHHGGGASGAEVMAALQRQQGEHRMSVDTQQQQQQQQQFPAHQQQHQAESQFLSSSMQHVLNLDEGAPSQHQHQHQAQQQQQLSGFPPPLPPGAGGGGGRGGKPIQVAESDSFQKSLDRVLKHSESDSFKHLLDDLGREVSFLPSPTGGHGEEAGPNGAQDFAAFLDDHFSDADKAL